MESQNPDLNTTISTVISDQPENLKTHSLGKVVFYPSDQEDLSHSTSNCSSPDSPLIDPFNGEDDPIDNTEPSTEAHTMEHVELSSYRIPSSVFSSNASPGDWSVTSNESLFSISGDNASFKNDHLPFWMSGELGYSDQKTRMCSDSMRNCEMGLAEATMKEVIMESESNPDLRNHQASPSLAIPSRCSHESNTSTTSYAFAVKGGGSDRFRATSSVRSMPDEQYQSPPSSQVMVEAQAAPLHWDEKPHPAGDARRKKWLFFIPRCC